MTRSPSYQTISSTGIFSVGSKSFSVMLPLLFSPVKFVMDGPFDLVLVGSSGTATFFSLLNLIKSEVLYFGSASKNFTRFTFMSSLNSSALIINLIF